MSVTTSSCGATLTRPESVAFKGILGCFFGQGTQPPHATMATKTIMSHFTGFLLAIP
ncbi:MAG: hypothetical protein AB1664_04600 [Thermodesulfobacteriota bacterium]